MCGCVDARACERAAGLESAVRMHSRDQRLLGECALNLSGLAAEIVLCFPKYMLSLERRRAADQSVSHHPSHSYIWAGGFHAAHVTVALISPFLRSSDVYFLFVSTPRGNAFVCGKI